MATECFCGCGSEIPQFPIGTRAINTRGKQVKARLGLVDDDWPHLKNESPEIGKWVLQGKAIVAESDPRALKEKPVRAWQTKGRTIEDFINHYVVAFRRWADDMGYGQKDAIAAAARGEYQAPGVI